MERKPNFMQTLKLVLSEILVVFLAAVGFFVALAADFFEWIAGRCDDAIEFLSRWADNA